MNVWMNLTAAAALGMCTTAFAGPTIVINEVDADQPGTDMDEFIELYDGGVGNTDLTGLVVVLMNGSDDASYDAIDLDGQFTDGNGFFVIGSATVPNVDLVAFTSNGLQNGADAVCLYMGDAADFPNDTPVTATNLLDSVVYDTSDNDDPGLLAVLAGPQINENDGASVARLPDGTGPFGNLDPATPGTSNGMATPSIRVFKSGPDIALAGTQITYFLTVDNNGLVDAENVTIVDTLPAGMTFVSETSPASVTLDDSVEPTIEWSTPLIEAGTFVTIELTVELNALLVGDVDNTVDITTTTAGDDPGDNTDVETTTVNEQVDPPKGVFINEIRTGQPSTDTDEYFELKGNPGTSLAGLTYLVIGDRIGEIENITPLGGTFIGGSGLFLAAEDTMTLVPAPAIDLVTTLGFEDSDNVTHLLVANFYGGFGDDLDTNDDGVIDSMPWTDILDAVGLYSPTDEDLAYGADLGFVDVGPDEGDFVPSHVYRCDPDGLWQIGPFDFDEDDDTVPDGDDTPKAENVACAGPPCTGDTDDDGDVDVDDLNAVILDWGTDGSANGGDIAGALPGDPPDGIVNVNDLNAIIVNWGDCP